MYEILYLPLAATDLNHIVSYISDHLQAPKAAKKLLDEFDTAISFLIKFPYAHPLYRPLKPLKKEFRILPVQKYSVFYIVREPEKIAEIYRVIYAKRDLRQQLL